MGLLLRRTHIWPLWDIEHFGNCPNWAGGPLGWVCVCGPTMVLPQTTTRSQLWTGSWAWLDLKGCWAASLCFFPWGDMETGSASLCMFASLLHYTHSSAGPCFFCPTFSNSSGFSWCQHWPFPLLDLVDKNTRVQWLQGHFHLSFHEPASD